MKKFLIVMLALLPLAGCPKNKKEEKGKQPDPATQTTPDKDSQPSSDQATPGAPKR